jgi:hypothetical protein
MEEQSSIAANEIERRGEGSMCFHIRCLFALHSITPYIPMFVVYFAQSHAEYAIVPLKVHSRHVQIALHGIECKVVVIDAPRFFAAIVVNDNPVTINVGYVGEGFVAFSPLRVDELRRVTVF